MRRLLAMCGAAVIVVACSSSDGSDSTTYTGDPLAAIKADCQRDLGSSAICTGACHEAQFNQSANKGCPEADPLTKDSGFQPYVTCRNACPAAKTCPASGAQAEAPFADCDCLTACAAKQSKRFQGYLAYSSDCVEKLPACQ